MRRTRRRPVKRAGGRHHPLARSVTSLRGTCLSGTLSLTDHPWLADHVMFGTVVLSGTTFLELAFAAARTVRRRTVSALTMVAPLTLPSHAPVLLQLILEPRSASGAQAFLIHSRPAAAPDDGLWTPHALGVLGPEGPRGGDASAIDSVWPPPGAEPHDLSGRYDRLASAGMAYGPSFQGLVEAWRQDGTVFGRIVLPAAVAGTADAYGLHPALLDAAAQTMRLALEDDPAWLPWVLMPVAWSDVTLYAPGATELRVCLDLHSRHCAWGEATASLHLTDTAGQRVARVGALTVRRMTSEEAWGEASRPVAEGCGAATASSHGVA